MRPHLGAFWREVWYAGDVPPFRTAVDGDASGSEQSPRAVATGGLLVGVLFALSAPPSFASPFAPIDDFIVRKLGHVTVYAV